MSTPAVVIFDDGEGEIAIYKHWDGQPSNIARLLDDAREGYSWPLPRFEADEFAAAFVRAAKDGSGDVRILRNPRADVGQAFTYTVKSAVNRHGGRYLNVMCYGGLYGELPLWCGATGGFREWARKTRIITVPA
jgi:hypothetical protein